MAQWSLHSQHSHFSNKTLPLANVLCCLHTKISAQAFCSSYCFVICCTIRKHLALGMVPFSRKNNTKNISRTQKANQTHTYTQNNNNNNNDKPTTPPPKKPNPKTNKTKMPYNLAKTQTKPKKKHSTPRNPAEVFIYHKRKGTEYETPPKPRCVWAPYKYHSHLWLDR